MYKHDPKTKADILDRVLRRDFHGDFSELGAEGGQVQIDRKRPNVLALTFPKSGETFELTVHKRRVGETSARRPARKSAEETQPPEVAAQGKKGGTGRGRGQGRGRRAS